MGAATDGPAPGAATGAGGTATAVAAPTLAVEGVTVRFGGVTAVSDVSFEIEPARTCGLIGPNGAGKTTLFDVISGHQGPTRGRVLLRGEDVTGRSAVWRARHGLRRTFQRQQVFGGLTVADNLLAALDWRAPRGGAAADLLGLRQRGPRAQADRERVDEVLELCGLHGIADAYAASLPIGQARMVELARAVIDPPALLLLDEPTSGLDTHEVRLLSETIERVRDQQGCAILLVEHDIGFIMEHCSRILVLALGQLLADGTPDEIRNDPAVRDAYLG